MSLKLHATLASLVLVFSAGTPFASVTELQPVLAPAVASDFTVHVDRRDGVPGPADLNDPDVLAATRVMRKLLMVSTDPTPDEIEQALAMLGTVTSESEPIYAWLWDDELEEFVLICFERELYLIDEASEPNPVAVRVERPM